MRPLTLRIDGESPRKYYSRPSKLLVRLGDLVLLNAGAATAPGTPAPLPSPTPTATTPTTPTTTTPTTTTP